jgi:hypothetical protein
MGEGEDKWRFAGSILLPFVYATILLFGLFYLFFASAHLLKQDDQRPRVVMVSPDSSAVGISPCASVTAYASVPTNGGIDNRPLRLAT